MEPSPQGRAFLSRNVELFRGIGILGVRIKAAPLSAIVKVHRLLAKSLVVVFGIDAVVREHVAKTVVELHRRALNDC